MPNNTLPYNPSAYHTFRITQDSFQPTDPFNHRTSLSTQQLLILSQQIQGASLNDAVTASLAMHEAASFGLLPATSLQHSLNSRPPASTQSVSTLTPEQVLDLLEMGTSNAFFSLFQAGHLLTLVINGYHAIQCPKCSQHISTSVPSSVILGNSGHFHTLTCHYRRRPCLNALSRKEQEAATTILEEITSPVLSHRSSSSTSHLTRCTSLDSISGFSESDMYIYFSSYFVPLLNQY